MKKNIIFLIPLKGTGPNIVPTKNFKLLINDISYQLTKLFNLYFSHGVSTLILKINEFVPAYKKDSKVLCYNYRPISLFSNINKIIERLVSNTFYKFLEINGVL